MSTALPIDTLEEVILPAMLAEHRSQVRPLAGHRVKLAMLTADESSALVIYEDVTASGIRHRRTVALERDGAGYLVIVMDDTLKVRAPYVARTGTVCNLMQSGQKREHDEILSLREGRRIAGW